MKKKTFPLVPLVALVMLVTIAAFLFLKNKKKKESLLNNKDSANELVSTYVINLERNKDRMDNFREKYEASDLAQVLPYTRFEAVDGSKVPIEKYLTPEALKGLMRTEASKLRSLPHDLTKGMVGCYLSHLGVYDIALKQSTKYALVFEDDAVISPDIYTSTIEKIIHGDEGVPPDWDMILLGVVCRDCRDYNEDYNKVHDFFGTHGYIINRKAMKVLKNSLPITTQIDVRMSELCREKKFKVFSVKNLKVDAGGFGSDIQVPMKES